MVAGLAIAKRIGWRWRFKPWRRVDESAPRSAQTASSPGQAAARATGATRTLHATEDSDPEPAATDRAAATAAPVTATPATAAAVTATPAAAASVAATTASAGHLHAAADVLLVEEIERGETDVGHFLLAKHEALIGRGIVGWRDVGSGHRGCRCITRQRKTEDSGTQHRHGGFGGAFLLRSLLDPWHWSHPP